MATYLSSRAGLCPTPFLDRELFSNDTGYIPGRFCQPYSGTHCCLPCPMTDWLYTDNLKTTTRATNWINVMGLTCALFVLLSYATLPVEKTHRHYLSVCLIIGIVAMHVSFITPLVVKPVICADLITPSDMFNDKSCAFAGALLLAGGWSVVMWVFLRALSLHLQICWQIAVARRFMYWALATGWGIPAITLTIELIFSGVSYRFGDTCHINLKNSLVDLWIPLMLFTGLTAMVQFATFAHCIRVYIASLTDSSPSTESSGFVSTTRSLGTLTPRQAYHRIRRLIELQWRGITVVILILTEIIFFVIVSVYLDKNQMSISNNPAPLLPWLLCLTRTHGNKDQCLYLVSGLVGNEAVLVAVLVLYSLNGFWVMLMLGRLSIFTGWYELIKDKIRPEREFVSADANLHPNIRSRSLQPHEMLDLSGKNDIHRTSDIILTPIEPGPSSGKDGRITPDYFGKEARYYSPSDSFSSPRPPPPVQQNSNPLTRYPYYMDSLSMNKV